MNDRSRLRVVSGDTTTSRDYQQAAAAAPSGGGGYDGMEARVAKLESDVGHLVTDMAEVRQTLGSIRERVSALEVKVDHLPSKDFVVKVFLGGFAAFVALSGFITLFQGQLQRLFGLPTH